MAKNKVVTNTNTPDESTANFKEMSPGKMVMRRFLRSRLSMIGLGIIIFLFAFSFLGPLVFNRWGEIEVDNTPGITQIVENRVDGNEKVGTNDIHLDGYIVYEITPSQNIKAQASKDHWLGTDEHGQDVFARLMYGGRISLMIGFIVVILETIVGVLFGGIAGYFGKWIDQVIMRIVDIFNCIPTLPILLIASGLLDSYEIAGSTRIYYLMIILTIFGWAGTARIVRGQILFLREQEYMVATEVMGLPVKRKIIKHLIPNVMPQLIVSMTLGLGSVILYESTLSYLGLGVQAPYAAWGTMISSAKDPVILMNYFNLWGPPGICIVLAVLGFNFVGDGLRDAFDPKMKR